MYLNLAIKLTDLRHADLTSGAPPPVIRPLLVCDRCQNIDEVVVAILEILPLEETWSLCGPCKHELPDGFQLV